MQQGSLAIRNRLEGPDVWEFRWSEKAPHGKRVYRKRVIGTVDQYPQIELARTTVAGLIAEVNWAKMSSTSIPMTVAQLAHHFEQRELAPTNTWRSYSTKKCYSVYLQRWILPTWATYELRHIRTVAVEAWLRGLPLARSSCAKIRNLMSVLFNTCMPIRIFRSQSY
jgi:hypothetical protein